MSGDASTGAPLRAAPSEPAVASLLARIRALNESRALRDAEARCVAEGARFFLAALASGARAHAVGLCRSHCTAAARRAYEQARVRGVEHIRLTREELLSVSRRPDPDGLVAIVGAGARRALPENCISQDRWLAFDHIRSPGNLGTLRRSARATGARGAIALSPRVDFFDPAAVRASMGALFELELVSSSPAELAAWARREHVRIVGASGEAVRDFRKIDWQGPVVLLLGGERRGLSARERELCDSLVAIPMEPGIDSLNVAIAGSLLLYEAYRAAPQGGPDRVRPSAGGARPSRSRGP
ncbi:MAG: RNA methyltransferase [Sandaracinaceae bacterium]|nr:RNA methyltransferase [Sandaracinaceae bacterium]